MTDRENFLKEYNRTKPSGSKVVNVLFEYRNSNVWDNFNVSRLENGRYMAYGMVYDGLVKKEYDTVDEAYAQYVEWVREREQHYVAVEKRINVWL